MNNNNMKGLVLMLILYCPLGCISSDGFNNLRRMSLSDIQDILRDWFIYYQKLEQQGLTTESDRRHLEQVYSIVASVREYRVGKRSTDRPT